MHDLLHERKLSSIFQEYFISELYSRHNEIRNMFLLYKDADQIRRVKCWIYSPAYQVKDAQKNIVLYIEVSEAFKIQFFPITYIPALSRSHYSWIEILAYSWQFYSALITTTKFSAISLVFPQIDDTRWSTGSSTTTQREFSLIVRHVSFLHITCIFERHVWTSLARPLFELLRRSNENDFVVRTAASDRFSTGLQLEISRCSNDLHKIS